MCNQMDICTIKRFHVRLKLYTGIKALKLTSLTFEVISFRWKFRCNLKRVYNVCKKENNFLIKTRSNSTKSHYSHWSLYFFSIYHYYFLFKIRAKQRLTFAIYHFYFVWIIYFNFFFFIHLRLKRATILEIKKRILGDRIDILLEKEERQVGGAFRRI